MSLSQIYYSKPSITEKEISYATNAAANGWGSKCYEYINKFERYEKRKSKIKAHKPDCLDVKVGDSVKIAECRQLSKTKHFVLVEVKEGE